MSVHDVDVQPIGVGHRIGFISEMGEVGGQDARGDHRFGGARSRH